MKVGAYEFLWCPPMAGSVEWARRWETGISASTTGKEEREAKRSIGLKELSWTGQTVTLEERLELEAAVREGLKTGKACAPFWGRGIALAADCSATTVTLEENLWGFVTAENVFLFDQESRLWEVRAISGVAGNVLTLSGGAVARTYKAGTLVWPLIFGKLVCEGMGLPENWRGNPALRIVENEPGFSKVETSCPVLATYLGRPIAPLGGTYAEGGSYHFQPEVRRNFRFDLNEIDLGFGSTVFAPLQNNVVNGWEWTAFLDGAEAIKAWDCFTASLPGRARGFWIRDASAIFQIHSAPAGDKVRIVDCGLTETWAADPAQHVVFVKEGASDQRAKISGVADLGGGVEEVTLDTALAGIDANWECYRLRYCRLADDVERASAPVEGRQFRQVRVVELPEEYAAEETGLKPVWLYTFWMETPGGNTYWRYTSFNSHLTSNGNVFAAGVIQSGDISRSMRGDAETVTIEAVRESGTPFVLLAPHPSPLPVLVKIEEATQGDLNTTSTLFVGVMEKGPMNGKVMTAKGNSAIDAFAASVPNFELGTRCKHQLYRAGTCGVDRAAHTIAVTIDAIAADRRTITVSGAGLNGNNPAGFNKSSVNYFAFGVFETGAGASYQVATILKSAVVDATHQTVILSAPLLHATAGNSATLAPGCDLVIQTCISKFNNLANNGSQPRMPAKSPGINRPTTSTGGSKK